MTNFQTWLLLIALLFAFIAGVVVGAVVSQRRAR